MTATGGSITQITSLSNTAIPTIFFNSGGNIAFSATICRYHLMVSGGSHRRRPGRHQ